MTASDIARPDEKEIYRQMWERAEYRSYAPGEQCVQEFLNQAKPRPNSTLLDLGCGTGRAGLLLALIGGLNVTLLDFADNCLDEDIRPMLATQSHALRFVEADLTQPITEVAQYGFCADVLEHIPPDAVDRVLDNCLKACQHCFFQISTQPDAMGALIGHPLHLTVQPYSWWLRRFAERDCIIHWSSNRGGHCLFYVTAWADGQEVVDVGILNTEESQVLENVRHNIAAGWGQVQPYETQDTEVMILGGGPSMPAYEEQIRQMRANGVKLVTLNGAYNWAIEHGIQPSAQIVVDAREFNNRFTRPVVDGCKYLIASQCHPSVLEGLPHERTLLWHTSATFITEALDAHYKETDWYAVMGGSTVLLRAIPLLRMLGFQKFHLFGCDSCVMNGEHHAYEQPENSNELIAPVICGSKTFYCAPWMTAQATEFMGLVGALGDEIELQIYGDGLLAYLLEYGAELAMEEEGQ